MTIERAGADAPEPADDARDAARWRWFRKWWMDESDPPQALMHAITEAGVDAAADAAIAASQPLRQEGAEPNTCKLTECQGKPRCRPCAVMDERYGPTP